MNRVASPKTCLMTVTNRCTLQCAMCDLWRMGDEGERSIEELLAFVERLKDFGSDMQELHLIGGEIFLKQGIFELIAKARSQGLRVVATTSGFPITMDVARRIASSGLSMLNFSLESMDPKVHDAVRGMPGVHARLMQALDLVAEHAPQVETAINTIIMKPNLDGLVDIVAWVNRHARLSHVYFMAIMRPFGPEASQDWHKAGRGEELWPDAGKAARVLDQLKAFKNNGAKIGNAAGQFDVFKKYFESPDAFVRERTGCPLGTHAINVNGKGDAHICFFMNSVGNIATDAPLTMWESKEAARVRADMASCSRNCELLINCYFGKD